MPFESHLAAKVCQNVSGIRCKSVEAISDPLCTHNNSVYSVAKVY